MTPETPSGLGVDRVHPRGELFFDTHRAGLQELFETLDMPTRLGMDLEAAVAHTQPWVKGDHTEPTHRVKIDDSQSDTLKRLYDGFGLIDERPLPAGHYDQLLVLGGMQNGNNRRLSFVNRTLAREDVAIDRVVLLAGQRPVNHAREGVDVKQNVHDIAEQHIVDSWSDRIVARKTNLTWETDLVRLAAVQHLGPLVISQMHLRLGPDASDSLSRYEFRRGKLPVTLLHTQAVTRFIDSPRRHTTEACIADWLQTDPIPADGLKVGLVAGNPHISRTLKSASRVLALHGRDDISLIPAGSAADDGIGHHYYLGEIARNLYEDKLALAAR